MPRLTMPHPKMAEGTFKLLEPTVLTTFHLPLVEQYGELTNWNPKEIIERMPFASFAVVEPFIVYENGKEGTHGLETILLTTADNSEKDVLMVSRVSSVMVNDDGTYSPRYTFYTPQEENLNGDWDAAATMLRLYKLMYGRKHRFVEKSVSRQVRRSEKRPPNYREYIIIGKEHVDYPKAMRPSDMMKRMRMLHVVRGHGRQEHLRELKSGKIVVVSQSWIPEHLRGAGEMVQVKDYVVGKEQKSPT